MYTIIGKVSVKIEKCNRLVWVAQIGWPQGFVIISWKYRILFLHFQFLILFLPPVYKYRVVWFFGTILAVLAQLLFLWEYSLRYLIKWCIFRMPATHLTGWPMYWIAGCRGRQGLQVHLVWEVSVALTGQEYKHPSALYWRSITIISKYFFNEFVEEFF